MSTIVDYTDRSTCPIFGDAAAAVLLEPNTEGYGVLDEILRSDGSGELQLYMKAGGSRYPASIETVQNNWHTIMWDGHAVFKAAVFRKWPTCRWRSWSVNNLTSTTSVIWFPIRPTCASSTPRPAAWGLTQDKCMINIDRNGNTTAATIPSCLYDYEKELRKGRQPFVLFLLGVFGASLVCVLRGGCAGLTGEARRGSPGKGRKHRFPPFALSRNFYIFGAITPLLYR